MSTTVLANPGGLFGLPVTFDLLTASFLSAETTTTIAAGNCVSVNTVGNILKATTVVSQQLTIGVALNAIVAGDTDLVVIRGIATVVADGAIAAGDRLIRSGAVAGALATKVAALTDIGGMIAVGIVAIADTASGLVYIQKY